METLPQNVRYFVADTETTGVDEAAAVCEVGWIEVDASFNILSERESLIDPQCLIPAAASAIHGIVNADVENSPTMDEFFSVDDPSCFGSKVTDPVVLIGHRISFDHRFLKPYFTNVVQELCTLRWARKLYPDSDNHQLSTLMYALKLPISPGAHRVMADIMVSYHLARHIAERTGMTLPELAIASQEPMELRAMPFGKYKGQTFSEVPYSYLKWMRNNMELEADLIHTINLALRA